MLGLDISSSAVKMVELSGAGHNEYRVERYVIEVLPKDAVVDGIIADVDAVQSGVRSAWKRMGTSVRNVAMALPAAAVISKKIIVQSGLRDDELDDFVTAEAGQHVPFAIDEINLDYQIIGPSASSPGELEVLLVASKKDRVEDRLAIADAVGLKTVVMDVESYAALSAFELVSRQLPYSSGAVVTLLDIGTNAMRLTALRDDTPVYVKEQAFGGGILTQDIARRYGMSYGEAEAAKRSNSLPDDYETELLPQFSDNLALEVARALQFFFTSTQFNKVDHIVLAGGGAAIDGIDKLVAARTQVNTIIANPFAGMMLSDKVRANNLQADAPSLMNACGLALRRFDPS
ncbi:fimbrial assembly protein [Betaproteobacteria bacterium]|nr:fimbrial assembly protein [Betaproteobacteria bacterium]GHU44152.1 fimbrial assembly protein [Betaproteobacteria bacterium]